VSLSADVVEIVYVQPRPGMLEAGARPGSLLFRGTFKGSRISGTAHIFNSRCGKFPYTVEGHASPDLSRIEMFGRAPRIRSASCTVVDHRDDVLVFQLETAGR